MSRVDIKGLNCRFLKIFGIRHTHIPFPHWFLEAHDTSPRSKCAATPAQGMQSDLATNIP